MLAQLAISELFESEPGNATCELIMGTLEYVSCAGGVEENCSVGAQSNNKLVGLEGKDHA